MDDNKIQELWNEYKSLLLSTKRDNIENLINWLDQSDFKYAPASTQYHNSFKGGLLKHSLNVYYAMADFQNWIDFLEIPKDSVIITALLHDICKVNCYEVSTRNTKNENGQWITVPYYIWEEQEPLGHGAKSVMLINEYGVQLTKIERAMIVNHMGFTSNDDERRVSKLFRICPQSIVLHCADLEATMILESYDGPQRFINKLVGKNITDSLIQDTNKIDKLGINNVEKNKVSQNLININGTSYEIAPIDSDVDGVNIIEIPYNDVKVKVFSLYKDGLPF